MREPPFDCLFCRRTRGPFSRVEHVVPESLGNDDTFLPAGFVCDPCNQYFGSKVESRVLASPPFNVERVAQAIRTKKGRLPWYDGPEYALVSTGYWDQALVFDKGDPERAWRAIARGVISSDTPIGYGEFLARFLIKVGLELLVWAENTDPYASDFDAARRCARFGDRATERGFRARQHG
jgi:hypothetical protein